ncbi:MAG: D-alanine--D-alanine ligase [Bacteroidetes bacterium]|nr:D-alanine--D-alanine ligase [Bacteroidota bacterium]
MTNRKLRVGVIFGGRSGEHEVSLVSAASVLDALDRSRYEVVPIGIARDGRWLSSPQALQLLRERTDVTSETECVLVPEPNRQGLMVVSGTGEPVAPLDVVIPMIHGTYGEDGTLQGLLELANIPYVGAGVLGSALGMDKIIQKQLFIHAGLRVAKYTWATSTDCTGATRKVVREVERTLRYPVFVKPANTGSSVGIVKAHNRKELLAGIPVACSYDRRVIFEQGILNAREIECSILGNDDPLVSALGEIIPSNEFYDYDAKYVDGKSMAIIPARLPRRTVAQIQRMARIAYRAIDCAGMARADFFLGRKSGVITINELNTIPGFTSISMYPKLWEAGGVSFSALLDRLIALALERHAQKSGLRRFYDPRQEWYRR